MKPLSNNAYCAKLILLEVIFLLLLTFYVDSLQAQLNYTSFEKTVRETLKIENAELRDWKAPALLREKFPFYFSGYDLDERPIWIIEFGKWDLRTFFEEGDKQRVALYEKYVDQAINLMHNSPTLWPKNQENPATDEWAFIIDMQDYSLRQLTSPEAVRQQLKLATMLQIAEKNLGYVLLLNTNFFGHSIINITKPVLGAVSSKLEVYGTNKSTWIPKILKKFPKESLAEWYGGFGNFTPVAVYG